MAGRPGAGRFEPGGVRGRRGAAPRCATDARPPTAPPRGRAPDATRRRHVAVAAPDENRFHSRRCGMRHRAARAPISASWTVWRTVCHVAASAASSGGSSTAAARVNSRSAVPCCGRPGGVARALARPGKRAGPAWQAVWCRGRSRPNGGKGGHGCAVWRGHDRLSIGTSRRDALITPGRPAATGRRGVQWTVGDSLSAAGGVNSAAQSTASKRYGLPQKSQVTSTGRARPRCPAPRLRPASAACWPRARGCRDSAS